MQAHKIKAFTFPLAVIGGVLFFAPTAGAFVQPAIYFSGHNTVSRVIEVKAEVSPQATEAQSFIQTMGNDVIVNVIQQNPSPEEERRKLKEVLNANFDMNTISRFMLGNHWKNLNEEQQTEYRRLLDEMIVSIYADRFDDYRGQKFEVSGSTPSGKDFIVNSSILPPKGEPIAVSWHVRPRDGGFKVVDVTIGGVSMIITQKADFASTIQRSGGDSAVILDYLRDKMKNKT